MTGKSGQVTSRAEEEKHFYISDKRVLGAERRLLEVIYGTSPSQNPTRTYFFEELDNGREWKDVKLYSGSSSARDLGEFASASRESLSGIGIDPNYFPVLWDKDIGAVVDELVPFLSKDKVER